MTAPLEIELDEPIPLEVDLETPDPLDASVAIGLRGPRGPQGQQGGVIEFQFSVESSTWTVNHTLNRYVAVYVMDESGEEMTADVEQPDTSTVAVTHAVPSTGRVLLS